MSSNGAPSAPHHSGASPAHTPLALVAPDAAATLPTSLPSLSDRLTTLKWEFERREPEQRTHQEKTRKGRPLKTWTDARFAAEICARYRDRHPGESDALGSFTGEYFRLLRSGRRRQPRIEILQAIAEFFEVDVGYLVPTASPVPPIHAQPPAQPQQVTTLPAGNTSSKKATAGTKKGVDREATESMFATRNEHPIGTSPALPPAHSPALPEGTQYDVRAPQDDLFIRRERITLVLDQLPHTLDTLTPSQAHLIEDQLAVVEHALAVAYRAIQEFTLDRHPMSTPPAVLPSMSPLDKDQMDEAIDEHSAAGIADATGARGWQKQARTASHV